MTPKTQTLIMIFAVLLQGCMTSGVVKTGPDSYMARANSTAFSIDPAGGDAIANATIQANEHCAKMNKHMVSGSITTTRIGAGAQALLNFECVDSTDKDYRRPNIQPIVPFTNNAPTVVINQDLSKKQ